MMEDFQRWTEQLFYDLPMIVAARRTGPSMRSDEFPDRFTTVATGWLIAFCLDESPPWVATRLARLTPRQRDVLTHMYQLRESAPVVAKAVGLSTDDMWVELRDARRLFTNR